MPQRRTDRYTAGQLDNDLFRVIGAIVADYEASAGRYQALGLDPGPSDRRLRRLRAVHAIRSALDRIVDDTIIGARRQDPVLAWREIGAALGMTGQAVGQHARKRGLAVDPVTAADVAEMVDQARQARGLAPLPADRRPTPSVEKYDELLERPNR